MYSTAIKSCIHFIYKVFFLMWTIKKKSLLDFPCDILLIEIGSEEGGCQPKNLILNFKYFNFSFSSLHN